MFVVITEFPCAIYFTFNFVYFLIYILKNVRLCLHAKDAT